MTPSERSRRALPMAGLERVRRSRRWPWVVAAVAAAVGVALGVRSWWARAAPARAIAARERACTDGDAAACLEAGRATPRTDRASLEREEALFSRGCDRGDPASCFEAGELRHGRPSLGGDARARPAFEAACAHDHAEACERAGRLAIGWATPAELERARPALERACTLGSASGCAALASAIALASGPDELPGAGPLRRARLLAAYGAAVGGRPERARALAEPFLRAPEDTPARLVLACVALDAGRLDDAGALLAALTASPAPDPAVVVLSRLVDRRRRGAGPWPDALVSAWAAAGKPDVRASQLGSAAGFVGAVASPRLRPVPGDAASALLVAYGDLPADTSLTSVVPEPVPVPLVERALALADDPRDEIALLAATVLTRPALAADLEPRARASARRALAALALRRPDESVWPLWDTVVGTPLDVPLEPDDVARVEAAAARHRWGAPFAELYAAYRVHLAPLDPLGERERAFGLAVAALPTEVALALSRRIRVTAETASAADRARLARAARVLGDQLAANGTLLESAMARHLLDTAAELSGSPADTTRAQEVLDRFRRDYDEWGTTRSALGSWPLRRCTEEWWDAAAGGELAFFDRLRRAAAP
jgi:hypothetical protein